MESFSNHPRTLLIVSYPSLFVDIPSCRRSSRGHRTIDSTFFAVIYVCRDGPFNVIIFVITRQQFFSFPSSPVIARRKQLHDVVTLHGPSYVRAA